MVAAVLFNLYDNHLRLSWMSPSTSKMVDQQLETICCPCLKDPSCQIYGKAHTRQMSPV